MMKPDFDFAKVIDGKRYAVATATLLAADDFWDGSNFERGGRNTFLYKTPNGAYFQVRMTQWQGERNTLTPLDKQQAMDLYSRLPEIYTDFEPAFDMPVQEA